MSNFRESERAYVRLKAVVTGGGRSWTGRTRDVSRGGTLIFVDPPYPQGAVVATIELPSGELTVKAEVRFTIPGVGVGLQFVDLGTVERERIRDVVQTAATTFGLWGMVGKYLAEGDTRSSLRLATPGDSLFEQMRASLHKGQAPVSGELGQHVLFPVGENGMAYQILFTRPGCVPPADSELASTLSGFTRATQGKVARVAPQDVLLKLHAGSQPKPYRVAELTSSGFAAVVSSESPGAPPRISLLTLVMGEQIAISHKGAPLFPKFTDDELEKIRLDSVRSEEARAAEEQALLRETLRARFTDQKPFDEANERALAELLQKDSQVEVRKYGQRTVTLHPHVLMRLHLDGGEEFVGVPLHDGKRYCLLQLTTDGFGKVSPIARGAAFSVVVR